MNTRYIAAVNGNEYVIELIDDHSVVINDVKYEIDFQNLRQPLSYSLLVDGGSYEVNIYQENGGWEVLLRGKRYSVRVEDEREQRLKKAGGETIRQHGKVAIQAPMPGLVIDIPVSEGEQVKKGDVLLVLESMKMQNELTSPRDGKVSSIQTTLQENVDRKQILLVLE